MKTDENNIKQDPPYPFHKREVFRTQYQPKQQQEKPGKEKMRLRKQKPLPFLDDLDKK